MLSVWGRDLVALILYADLGFAIGLLARSPVTVLGGAIAVETIVRPVTMLIFEAPNPAMFLPFGLVLDINGTNPLAAINGATVTSSGIAPYQP